MQYHKAFESKILFIYLFTFVFNLLYSVSFGDNYLAASSRLQICYFWRNNFRNPTDKTSKDFSFLGFNCSISINSDNFMSFNFLCKIIYKNLLNSKEYCLKPIPRVFIFASPRHNFQTLKDVYNIIQSPPFHS